MKRMALVCTLVLAIGVTALAQRGGYLPVTDAANPRYDGRFMFMRLKYTVGPGGYYYQNGLPSWAHGQPFAEENMMKIMDAVSLLKPHIEQSAVVGLDNPEMFKFPVAFMVEPGFWVMSDAEGAALRAYLQKGGFLIIDDFREGRGSSWDNFAANMQRVIPGADFVPMDINHPIFHSFFEINSFDVIPQAYDGGGRRGGRGGGGGFYTPPEIYGLFEDNDVTKRLLAIINYNTDISNFWEFSGRGFYIVDDSNEAYKLGANYLIYGLTH
jgi:hypothetical protein